MAQAEDTELRDLVIEALEKNGSLAKIRALLRANIFLAFEDECENTTQNVSLDNILNNSEGILSLSIIHEFLDFCNLKNTLFVYKSESRQGRAYNYEGQKALFNKLNMPTRDPVREPILVSIIKVLKSYQRKYLEQDDPSNKMLDKKYDGSYKDDQNSTYIVHEDSSTASSSSQSDNSSDEKNKLHLRLQLDNSDTDTSSDSARDKTSSEYVPNEHIIVPEKDINNVFDTQNLNSCVKQNTESATNNFYLSDLKVGNNSSSDSTSYADLKLFTSLDKKLINTAGLPIIEKDESQLLRPENVINKDTKITKQDSAPSATLNSVSSMSSKNENSKNDKEIAIKAVEESGRSDVETVDYSYDFSPSGTPKKDVIENPVLSPSSANEELDNANKNSSTEGHLQNSRSSQSSISISDVADLISEKSFSLGHTHNDIDMSDNKSKLFSGDKIKKIQSRDDSGDYSESPVPSLSNLSLDIHSD